MILIRNNNKNKKIKSYNLGLVIKKKEIVFFKKRKLSLKNISIKIEKYNFFIKNIIKNASIKILAKKKEINEIRNFINLKKKILIENIFLKKRLYKAKLSICNKLLYNKKIKEDLFL